MDQSESLIERLVDLERPDGVCISPSGRQVVYQTFSLGRKSDDSKAALWLADVDVKHSARQLTSGLYHDRSPSWMPDGKSIVFISDRAKPGKLWALYCLNVADGGGEPFPLTDVSHEKPVNVFKIEPSTGKFIAIVSVDEDSVEKKRKQESKDDAQVDGQDGQFARLRLLHVATKLVRPIYAVERHVLHVAWSDDSSTLTCLSRATPDQDNDEELRFSTVRVSSGEINDICDFRGSLFSDICYDPFNPDEILFIAAASSPSNPNFAAWPYALNLKSKHWRETNGPGGVFQQSWSYESNSRTGAALVYKSHAGTADRADIFIPASTGTGWSTKVFRTDDQGREFNFPMCDFALGQHSGQSRLVGAYIRTSTEHLDQVVSITTGLAEDDQEHWTETVLSDHGAAITERPYGSRPLQIVCRATSQREWFESFLFLPKHVKGEPKKLPCVVLIHGGPYSRCENSFDPDKCCWFPLLANKGYAILSPNYAGSSGKGGRGANLALGQVGTVDYDDILAATWTAISRGYIDKDRLIVGGWSEGGFLSYLAATRNRLPMAPDFENGTDERKIPPFSFKGAICGAGISDWDMMVSTSIQPSFQAQLCGGRPWTSDKNNTSTRRGSPLWEMSQASKEGIPAILALHGKEDTQVPWTQALAYSRACKDKGVPCEFVTYPREDHSFVERAHHIDRAQRVLRFVDLHIG